MHTLDKSSAMRTLLQREDGEIGVVQDQNGVLEEPDRQWRQGHKSTCQKNSKGVVGYENGETAYANFGEQGAPGLKSPSRRLASIDGVPCCKKFSECAHTQRRRGRRHF